MFVLKAQFIAGSSTSQDMEISIDLHREKHQRYHGLLKQRWSLIAQWEHWYPVFRSGSFGGIAELLGSKMDPR